MADRPVRLFGRAGGPLSNFAVSRILAPCPHCGAELHAATVEHAFQAAKAGSCDGYHRILVAPGPRAARQAGRQAELRGDWEQPAPDGAMTVKAAVMLQALRAKYQAEPFRGLLLGTGQDILIEDAPWDAYWGAGPDGHGRNALGRLLMKVRAELAGDPDAPVPGPTPPVRR